jgi:Zn-dependent protease
MDWGNLLQRLMYFLPGVVIGLTVHEFLHAFIAFRLGDPTAKLQNRVTLNPLRHIDPVGFIFLILVGFGWAKPVQINRAYLRHPRRDEVLISLGGPAGNLALALVLSVIFRLIILAFGMAQEEGSAYSIFLTIFYFAIRINYALFIFNMLPVPPLDGSHLLFAAIRVRPETEAKIYRYGSMCFLGLLVISLFLEKVAGFGLFDWINPMIDVIAKGVFHLLGM